MILRFLALRFDRDQYAAPMVSFLNAFMGKNKNLSAARAEEMQNTFRATVGFILSSLGKSAFRPTRVLNAAVFDSVMVGTAERLVHGCISDPLAYTNSYNALIANATYLDFCARGTASEERVRQRLKLAIEAFSSVP